MTRNRVREAVIFRRSRLQIAHERKSLELARLRRELDTLTDELLEFDDWLAANGGPTNAVEVEFATQLPTRNL